HYTSHRKSPRRGWRRGAADMMQLPGKTKVHGLGTLRPAPCPRQRGPSRFCSKPSRLPSPRTAERETAETAAQMPQSSASSTIGASGVSVGGHSPTSRMGWAIIKATLQEANHQRIADGELSMLVYCPQVKALSAQEVVFAQGRGAPVIDVRPADQFKAGHVPGAVNVPYYQPIQGWDAMKIARRVGYALFGVLNGTEVRCSAASAPVPLAMRQQQQQVERSRADRAAGWEQQTGSSRLGAAELMKQQAALVRVNPDFSSQAGSHVHPELGAVLYCSIGGSLEAQEGASRQGMQSRSLIATWQLLSDGHKGLSILKGGFSEWCKNGRDVESWEEVEEDAA
ncbi:hypothetical protein QJQ45_018347, partial [Haematococcus lacustris]